MISCKNIKRFPKTMKNWCLCDIIGTVGIDDQVVFVIMQLWLKKMFTKRKTKHYYETLEIFSFGTKGTWKHSSEAKK